MTGEGAALGARYRIDARRGEFTVQAFAEGWLSFVGHNPTFVVRRYGGEIQFAADNTRVDSMLLVVVAESLQLLDKVGAKDAAEIENTLRRDVLQTAQYPEIVFDSQAVTLQPQTNGRLKVTADGLLTLCGASRRHTISADAEINGATIRARGELRLKQSDYRIAPVSALGGTLKVKDEVQISFEIAAQI